LYSAEVLEESGRVISRRLGNGTR